MPSVVDLVPPVGTGRRHGTDWKQYLDGRVYRFVEGVDFKAVTTGKSKNMLPGFWWSCRVNGLKAVRRERVEDGVRVLYLQAVKPE